MTERESVIRTVNKCLIYSISIPPLGGPGGILDLPAAITSSILNNIEAASVADFIICSLTTRGSSTSCLNMSVTFVFLTSTPVHLAPLFCFARNSAIVSIGSIPAFSARESGIESSASANFWTASCALPSRLLDHPLNSLAMYASVAPLLLLLLEFPEHPLLPSKRHASILQHESIF